MCKLAQDCPGYGFESHKGYAVPEHLEALNRLGPTAHHRRLLAPVVAAREKHEAIAVAGRLVLTRTEAGIEVSAEA
jgi:ribonuclease HII